MTRSAFTNNTIKTIFESFSCAKKQIVLGLSGKKGPLKTRSWGSRHQSTWGRILGGGEKIYSHSGQQRCFLVSVGGRNTHYVLHFTFKENSNSLNHRDTLWCGLSSKGLLKTSLALHFSLRIRIRPLIFFFFFHFHEDSQWSSCCFSIEMPIKQADRFTLSTIAAPI